MAAAQAIVAAKALQAHAAQVQAQAQSAKDSSGILFFLLISCSCMYQIAFMDPFLSHYLSY
jgi:hypothetical protein